MLILADDFTGACDAAASFAAERGTLVVLGVPGRWPAHGEGVEVLAVDLDLRERSNAEAEARTRETAHQVGEGHQTDGGGQAGAGKRQLPVFLKIDSTLRGPIAGLVAGALAGSGRDIAVIAPAFPEQGRFLREGRLRVDGQTGTSLVEVLGMDHTAVLGAHSARSAEEVELAVEHARARGARYVVVDADGNDCLRSVAHAWQRHATDWLLVGSAGLARQVAAIANHQHAHVAMLGREHLRRAGRDHGQWPGQEPVLVIAGSPAPATQAQIEQLRGLGPIVLIDGAHPVPRRPAGLNEVVVLCTRPARERDSGERAQAVAEAAAAWAPGFRPGALVLAGGTTARLVCERLGVRGVRLQGELEPGIPFGYLVGGIWAGLPVVTKAGGFGNNEALLDVIHALGVSSIAERTHD